MSDVAEVEESKTKESSDTAPKIAPWERLRQAREKENLTPADIAKELKLDIRFVKALEAGQLEKLPQPVYTAGYIRAYAKLVGLPPDDIVGDYASQESTSMPEIVQSREKIPARYRHVDNSLPKSFSVSHGGQEDKKSIRIFVSGLAIAVVLAIAWQVYINMQAPDAELPFDTKVDSTPPDAAGPGGEGAEEAQPAGESPEQKTVKLAIPGQSPAAGGTAVAGTEAKSDITSLQENAEKLVSISLRYSEDSWIDVRDATGKPLIRRLGKAGGSNTVSGVPPFEVLLGYSPGVSIEYNGEPYDISRFQARPVARFVMDSNKQPVAITGPTRSVVTGNAVTGSDKATNYGTVDEE
ncbi:RodZ domain-containing protein [Kaarinaea lacus]